MTAVMDDLAPPREVRDRWKAAAARVGERQTLYARRWTALWHETVANARANGRMPDWSPAHLSLVEDYVEAKRKAFEYEHIAQADPFPTNGAGRPMPHPGVAMAAASRREAREVLAELLLTPAAARGSGPAPAGDPDPVDEPGPDGDQAGL